MNEANEKWSHRGTSYATFSAGSGGVNFCRTHVAFHAVAEFLDPKQDFRTYKRDSDGKQVHGLWSFLDTARAFDLFRCIMKSRGTNLGGQARSKWKTLALTTIWTSKASTDALCPVGVRDTFGQKMMPAYLIAKIKEPFLLAKALSVWRKMSPDEQRLLTAALKSLTKYEEKLAKDARASGRAVRNEATRVR